MAFLERLGNWIWNPWLLGAFLLLGLYYSVRSGFFQVFECRLWLKATIGSLFRGRKRGGKKGLTQVQALSTALASTIGTGSIAGVATAIFYGGPGAVFWMWMSAFLGMMTGCAEKTLAVRYRRRDKKGAWQGGPMDYMDRGLGLRPMALLFSLFCVAASIGGGDMVQANSIATALEHAFGWDRLAVGVVTALLTGLVILGGIGRIGRVSEKLVPVMALLFLGGGIMVLSRHAAAIPAALMEIVTAALTPKAAVGGGLGYGMATAMRYGVARGVFTNEAGLGSSAMAHKRNPTGCQVALAAATRATGLVAGVLGGLPQEEERGLGGWQAEAPALAELFCLASGSLDALAVVAEGLEIDAGAIARNLDAAGPGRDIGESAGITAALLNIERKG